MTIPEAVQRYPIQLSPQLIRVWCQRGTCPFCYIVREGESRNSYYINEAKLRLWLEGKI